MRQALEAAMAAKRVKGLAASTLSGYQQHLDSYIYPELGDRPIGGLTAQVLRDRYAEILATNPARIARGEHTIDRATVHAIHCTVRSLLSVVAKDGVHLTRNPARDVEFGHRHKKAIKVWGAEQLGAFLDFTEKIDDHMVVAWHIMICLGLRRGELCGLRWSYIDLDTGVVTIPSDKDATRIVVRNKAQGSAPKTPGSAAALVLDAATLAAVRRHKARQAGWRLAAGRFWRDEVGMVLTYEDGRPCHPDSVSQRFKRLAARACLPEIPLKNLRHSSATHGLNSGAEDIFAVSRRLRHSSTRITSEFYAGETPVLNAAAAEARSAAIPRARPPHPAPHPTQGDEGVGAETG
ncbi:tyrosine-type recombinase/integrase [Frankia sp. AvcI1]|uniref:site-specific integrase n=1 Tax=Frankia sp. AvcI1 TaxID=573496 RepID=UPI0021175F22|nr:tyrosine-type recombinase/integrase [Frankia sp. AvcI1]